MAIDIKMILQEDRPGLGKKGDTIEVTSPEQVAYFEKNGFAKVASDKDEKKEAAAHKEDEAKLEDAKKVVDAKVEKATADEPKAEPGVITTKNVTTPKK